MITCSRDIMSLIMGLFTLLEFNISVTMVTICKRKSVFKLWLHCLSHGVISFSNLLKTKKISVLYKTALMIYLSIFYSEYFQCIFSVFLMYFPRSIDQVQQVYLVCNLREVFTTFQLFSKSHEYGVISRTLF